MADQQAGPSSGTGAETRTSSRVRHKSARQLESEQSQRLLQAARRAEAESAGPAEPAPAPPLKQARPTRSAKAAASARGGSSKAGKAKTNAAAGKIEGDQGEEADYCVCKREREGPMIECAECNDWFHFDCVGLDDEDAAEIDTYVCETCEGRTGKTTSLLDASTDKRKGEAGSDPASAASSPASASASDGHAPPASDSSAGSGDAAGERARKRARLSASPLPSPSRARPKERTRAPPGKPLRKASGAGATPAAPTPRRSVSGTAGTAGTRVGGAELPPARQYVVDRLGEVVALLFAGGRLGADEQKTYAREMEDALFAGFKDVGAGGKATAGVRYKAQFNLLASSLNASLRPELLASIWARALSPAQVAGLTAAELASAARLAELERARQDSLQQTVKAKEEVAGVRFGRDGFEKVEDVRERELAHLLEREQAGRLPPGPRASAAVADGGAGSPDVDDATGPGPVSARADVSAPKVPAAPSPVARRTSAHAAAAAGAAPHSPATEFAISSAWGGGAADGPGHADGKDHAEPQVRFAGDQDVLDLSDIVGDEAYDDDLLAEPAATKSDWDAFLERPVVWSGTLGIPDTPPAPPVTLRLVSGRSPADATSAARLVPAPKLEIIGRVPSAESAKFLRERRFDSKLELAVGAFALADGAGEAERKAWDDMVAFYVNRDRHGLCWPHGKRAPPGTAKELYLVPLRPADAPPEIVGLVEHCAVPATRDRALFIGVFLVSKDAPAPAPVPHPHPNPRPHGPAYTPMPPAGYTPTPTVGYTPLAGAHTPLAPPSNLTPLAAGGATPPGPPPVPAPAPTPGLQALLANLDIPTILKSAGGASPANPANPANPASMPGHAAQAGSAPYAPPAEPYGWHAGPPPAYGPNAGAGQPPGHPSGPPPGPGQGRWGDAARGGYGAPQWPGAGRDRWGR